MTELKTGKSKLVRMDIVREKQNTSDHVGTWNYYLSYSDQLFLRRFLTWKYRRNDLHDDFVEIIDTRCSCCLGQCAVHYVCQKCKAQYMCVTCHRNGGFAAHVARSKNRPSECDDYLVRKRRRTLLRKELPLGP